MGYDSSLYKIISKSSAARLRSTVGNLISNSQFAFIPLRQMLYGVLVINELIGPSKRNRKECLIIKVDFEKAYDCVCWNYLRGKMHRIWLGVKWKRWMESCVFNNSLSILLNGNLTTKFQEKRGLCQGDLLLPFGWNFGRCRAQCNTFWGSSSIPSKWKCPIRTNSIFWWYFVGSGSRVNMWCIKSIKRVWTNLILESESM